MQRLLISLSALFVAHVVAIQLRADTSLFIIQQDKVTQLSDRNADGDFLDFAEVSTYAQDLPASINSIAWHQGRLFAVVNEPSAILSIEDLNADGDAFDFSEVRTFAIYQSPAQQLKDIVALPDGSLLCANLSNGQIVKFLDLNADGDALEPDETIAIAEIDGTVRAISVRPDGLLLVAINSEPAPIRILNDLNHDRDYFDFAENLSYAENLAPGIDLLSPKDDIAYLSRPTSSDIVRLHDRTFDGDALDFAECTSFATGLDGIGAIVWAGDTIFAATAAQTSTLHAIRDLNEDGDALDFGEIQEVATELDPVIAIAVQTSDNECLLGDTNADGLVTPADIQSMADALVGINLSPELCRADMNGDGVLDARDMPLFVSALLD